MWVCVVVGGLWIETFHGTSVLVNSDVPRNVCTGFYMIYIYNIIERRMRTKRIDAKVPRIAAGQ